MSKREAAQPKQPELTDQELLLLEDIKRDVRESRTGQHYQGYFHCQCGYRTNGVRWMIAHARSCQCSSLYKVERIFQAYDCPQGQAKISSDFVETVASTK